MNQSNASIVSLKFPFETFYVYVHPEKIEVYKPFNGDGYYTEELTEDEYLELASDALNQTQVSVEAFKKTNIDLPFEI